MNASSSPATPRASVLPDDPGRKLMPLVVIIFTGFLCIGLPLPALPLYVHGTLGYGPLIVGCVVGTQALATIISRKFAGTYVDRHGPRRSVMLGLPLASASGAMYILSSFIHDPLASLAVLLLGRLLMGPAESFFLVGTMSWGIGRVGPQRTGMVMSWQGIAMFLALGLGAPLGILVMDHVGFVGVGLTTLLLPAIGIAIAWRLRDVPPMPHGREPVPFVKVLGMVWRQGAALALAASPTAVLNSFVVLYFANQGWDGAGLALTGFAAGYIGVRLFFGKLPDRIGGQKTAAVSLFFEAGGQVMLWLAPSAELALAGALLTGIGFSLQFPSMGVEAMRRAPPAVRGLAVGGFMVFVDITNGITGPVIGLLISGFGYRAAFLAGILMCAMSFLMIQFGMGPRPAEPKV